MTGPELARCLDTLGWSLRGLAERTGYTRMSVHRMASGQRPIEPQLATWLRQAAGWHERHPVPRARGVLAAR